MAESFQARIAEFDHPEEVAILALVEITHQPDEPSAASALRSNLIANVALARIRELDPLAVLEYSGP